MPIVSKPERAWTNRRLHLQTILAVGGYLLAAKSQRALTDDEVESGYVDGRQLSSREVAKRKLLQKRPFEPHERIQTQANLDEMLRIDGLAPAERSTAIAEALHVNLDSVRANQDMHSRSLARIETALGINGGISEELSASAEDNGSQPTAGPVQSPEVLGFL